jgi:hypothetical protein
MMDENCFHLILWNQISSQLWIFNIKRYSCIGYFVLPTNLNASTKKNRRRTQKTHKSWQLIKSIFLLVELFKNSSQPFLRSIFLVQNYILKDFNRKPEGLEPKLFKPLLEDILMCGYLLKPGELYLSWDSTIFQNLWSLWKLPSTSTSLSCCSASQSLSKMDMHLRRLVDQMILLVDF